VFSIQREVNRVIDISDRGLESKVLEKPRCEIRGIMAYAEPGRDGNHIYVGKENDIWTRRQFSVWTVLSPILSPGPRGGPECFIYS
jgi:hypothetical protein